MSRRFLMLTTLVVLVPAAAAWAAKPTAKSWAQPQIKTVVAQGVMGPDVATFRPNDPLTRGDAATLVAALTHKTAVREASPDATVPMYGLDARLVGALGLKPAGTKFAAGVRAAGLKPPSRFGTEVVARMLGLRTDHPAAQDDLELLPNDPATRAEAAFSAAQILRFSGWETQRVQTAADAFTLPALSPWQSKILQAAVSLIGYPYVWGGTSEHAEAPFKVPARGGFDCSGFVWRVYKLQPYAGAPALAGVLRGRTTYQMSGEVAKAKRITFAKLAPADVLFFGSRGARSKPSQVDHTGIYLGNGWFIHSSGQGVALATLSGWYRTRFAWGRRPLAEAGLGV